MRRTFGKFKVISIAQHVLKTTRLLIAALAVAACTASVSTETLAGQYLCVYGFGVEVLRLDRDGTYLQTALLDGIPEPLVHRGTWTYENETVNLQTPLLVSDEFGTRSKRLSKPADGLWVLSVVAGRGGVRLQWNPDLDSEFRKVR
jgi:hypothetical protein